MGLNHKYQGKGFSPDIQNPSHYQVILEKVAIVDIKVIIPLFTYTDMFVVWFKGHRRTGALSSDAI